MFFDTFIKIKGKIKKDKGLVDVVFSTKKCEIALVFKFYF
jgi:hypothetical protein